MTNLPHLIVSADWSVEEKKRWMVRAELEDGKYLVHPPEPVGEHTTLLERLINQIEDGRSALLGFDFPIGLPAEYAAKADLTTGFRNALTTFTTEDWNRFYQVSDEPELRQPFAPLPKKSGEKGFNRTRVANALGFDNYKNLLRRCDRKTDSRGEAEILFFTLGGKQVGRAAIVGWSDVITPGLDEISLWPFDGELHSLLSKPGLTIAEIYPGEAYSHLGVEIGSGTGRSKRRRLDRRAASSHITELAEDESLVFTNAAVSWVNWGFLDEDDFDAMMGLLSMILVVTGKRPSNAPDDSSVRTTEGWILGQDPH